ncbi:hypothetical protein C8R43DRAFT_947112 [Mycena crocata]|nr:hypothetical protein C8R43DRAFT_947112 [Mycena crocata]
MISSTDTGEQSPTTPLLPHLEYYDDEPDEEWKSNRKQIIADGFAGMIQEAKDRLEIKIQSIRGMGDGEEGSERARLVDEFHNESAAIKALAKEEFEHALARERLQRRLRRDLPIPATINHHHSLRLDLEQEQAATLKAATLNGDVNASNVEAAFRSLIDPWPSSDDRPSLSPTLEFHEDPYAEKDLGKPHMGRSDTLAVDPDAGALTIKLTRLPTEPPVNGTVGWVKASDAARKHELAVRQRANSKSEVGRIAAPPPQPTKKWVSASDAARRASHGRTHSQGV